MPNPQELDLKQLGSVLSRRRRMIFIATGVCIALALVVNLVSRPIYDATVTIEVRKEPNRSPITGEAVAGDQWQNDNIAVFTAAELVTNRTLLRDVVLKLKERGLLQMPDALGFAFWPKPRVAATSPREADPPGEDLNQEIDWLISITTVKPVRDTRLFNVDVEHWNPATATSIADVLASTFVATKARWLANADSSRAGEMSQQMQETRTRIKTLEGSLGRTASKAPVILSTRLKQLSDAINDLNDSYVKIQTDRLSTGARLARARAALHDSLADPGQLPIQSETLDALWRDLLARQTELARAREVYREHHPKLIMLETEVRKIRENIHAELAKTVSALDQEYAVLLEREKNLQATIASRESKLHDVSDALAQQTNTQSELQSSRDLYTTLTSRSQEEEASGAVRSPLAQIVGSATVGSKPVRPRKILNLVLGMMVGLMSGTGLALLQEYLRNVIRTPVDAAEQLQLPVLGMIPRRTQIRSNSRA